MARKEFVQLVNNVVPVASAPFDFAVHDLRKLSAGGAAAARFESSTCFFCKGFELSVAVENINEKLCPTSQQRL